MYLSKKGERMKKLLLVAFFSVFAASQAVATIGFTQVTVTNKADRDIWIYAWGKTLKATCGKKAGLLSKAHLPAFRLEPNDSMKFDKADQMKIRYYIDPKKVEKYVINANDEKIELSLDNKGVIQVVGGIATKSTKD